MLPLFFLHLFVGCNNASPLETLEHNGETREYILYVPEIYDDSNSVPLLFNFHGFGGTANSQMDWADMRSLADEHNFILVYPQGALLNDSSHWNSGHIGGDNKSTTDDFGFMMSLIDHLSDDYNIDDTRIYAAGYSNGGFLSYSLACYYSDRFAAIASVSSTMLNDFEGDCSPNRPVPVINLNGTADTTVPYEGGTTGFQSIPDVLEYWVNVNNITSEPITNSVDDNGTTVERTYYGGGTNGVAVDHYKIIGGEHVWFELDYEGSDTNRLIWDFFSQYDIHGLR